MPRHACDRNCVTRFDSGSSTKDRRVLSLILKAERLMLFVLCPASKRICCLLPLASYQLCGRTSIPRLEAKLGSNKK